MLNDTITHETGTWTDETETQISVNDAASVYKSAGLKIAL
jgi:hypothetical protein